MPYECQAHNIRCQLLCFATVGLRQYVPSAMQMSVFTCKVVVPDTVQSQCQALICCANCCAMSNHETRQPLCTADVMHEHAVLHAVQCQHQARKHCGICQCHLHKAHIKSLCDASVTKTCLPKCCATSTSQCGAVAVQYESQAPALSVACCAMSTSYTKRLHQMLYKVNVANQTDQQNSEH